MDSKAIYVYNISDMYEWCMNGLAFENSACTKNVFK